MARRSEFLVPLDVFADPFDPAYKDTVRQHFRDIMETSRSRPEPELRRELSRSFHRFPSRNDDIFDDIFRDVSFPTFPTFEKVFKEVKADVDENNKLLVELDLHEYEPEEITVKAVEDKLIVYAKKKTATMCKEFRREIGLPDGIDLNTVASSLAANGMLRIHAEIPQTPRSSVQSRSDLRSYPSQSSVSSDPSMHTHRSEVRMNVDDYTRR